MQCFICVTYMLIASAAQPSKERPVVAAPEQRSLFRDVIESLRVRSQLPENINHNDDNDLSPIYDRYDYEVGPPELPGDADFVPRRNDRIEMPSLKYRFPKSLHANGSEIKVENKREDIVVYVNTPTERLEAKSTPHKPKKDPKPSSKVNFVKQNDDVSDMETDETDDYNKPIINRMEDMSQIGNREYQTVIKPTVIVNFRGTVSHRDGEIRLEKRNNPKRKQDYDSARNIFNISQHIKLERPNGTLDVEEQRNMRGEVNQGVKVISEQIKDKPGDNMTACDAPSQPERGGERGARDVDNILQIIVTV
ncbi:uncharacterized protein [Battus philenor]|uniref:uncharacterized protein n=1 Tax=Battus philenor TaxID=42288 RepID=UPI0035CEFABF